MLYDREVSVFPCNHDFSETMTAKRCAVCKMPIDDQDLEIIIYNTVAIFCCSTCKGYYAEYIDKI